MTHDYAAQRAETFETFAEIGKIDDLPTTAVVNFLFLADDLDAPFDKATRALKAHGFTCRVDPDDDTLEARIGPTTITADAIWALEKRATELILALGFEPDGWEIVE